MELHVLELLFDDCIDDRHHHCYTAIFLCFMSAHQFERYLKLTQATVLIVLYCLESIALIRLHTGSSPPRTMSACTPTSHGGSRVSILCFVERDAAQRRLRQHYEAQSHDHRRQYVITQRTTTLIWCRVDQRRGSLQQQVIGDCSGGHRYHDNQLIVFGVCQARPAAVSKARFAGQSSCSFAGVWANR